MASLFRHQAKAYAAFRPTYPASLLAAVNHFAGPSRGTELAVDVATGTGQVAAGLLSPVFSRVIAQDASEAQLQHAEQRPNIEYSAAPAEATGLPDNCADLVTCAQALHWFDRDAFYAEANRILKPGGVLAVFGYGLFTVPSNPAVDEALHWAYEDVLGPYWDDRRRLVEAKYQGLEPAEGVFSAVLRRDDLTIDMDSTPEAVVGYVSSWSAYSTYREQRPDEDDPLPVFSERLRTAVGDGATVRLSWPLFAILARK